MNRAERRKRRRIQHKLIAVPKSAPSPIKGLVLAGDQKRWTCSCGSGWMTITSDDPSEAFDAHVASFVSEAEAEAI